MIRLFKGLIFFAFISYNLPLVSAQTDVDPLITSTSNDGFTVTWMSGTSEKGCVNYGPTVALGLTAQDERGLEYSGTTHSVIVRGLLPDKTYYFDVVSGQDVSSNAGAHFSVKTFPVISLKVDSYQAYGKVLTRDGVTPDEGAIVRVYLEDNDGLLSQGKSASISCLTDKSGNWHIELSNAMTESGNAHFLFSKTTDNLVLNVRGSNGKTANVTYCTQALRPANSMILGQDAAREFTPFAAGDTDADGKKDILVDFGQGYGIWVWADNTEWQAFHPATAKQAAVGDLDGNGIPDEVVDFGTQYGIFIKYNNAFWAFLHPVSPDQVIAADINADGKDELVVDFGRVYGVWIYTPATASWIFFKDVNPKYMVSGNIDGQAGKDLVVDFGSEYGIWVYYNGTNWAWLHSVSGEQAVLADINGDSRDEIIIDFGPAYGVWIFYPKAVIWGWLHSISPRYMVTGDVNGSGKKDIIVDFGDPYGIYISMDDAYWAFLHPRSCRWMISAGLDEGNKDDMVISFGDGLGLWVRTNETDWRMIHYVSP